MKRRKVLWQRCFQTYLLLSKPAELIKMTENDLRRKIIQLCLDMNASGLNQGTSGNISVRFGKRMLITPSGIPYDKMQVEDIANMPISGNKLSWEGPYKPSSEWHFHRTILKNKPDLNAVIHTHSTFATVLSIARNSIPAVHYMIGAFGGNTVECANYATFGTAELSKNIQKAMKNRTACLLANHGMVVGGVNLDKAMWAAIELETLAKQYYHARLAGDMVVLPEEEMDKIVELFKGYGQKSKDE